MAAICLLGAKASGDFGQRETVDARFVSHLDASVPWAGDYTGKHEVTNYFQALGGSVEVTDHPVESLIIQDDMVVATGDVSFVVRATNKPGSSKWVYIFTLADGRVRSFDQYNDAGLTEALS